MNIEIEIQRVKNGFVVTEHLKGGDTQDWIAEKQDDVAQVVKAICRGAFKDESPEKGAPADASQEADEGTSDE